jgi:hypothetical protein
MVLWGPTRRKDKRISFTSNGKDDSTVFVAKSKSSFSVGDRYSKVFFVDFRGKDIGDY